MSQVMPGLAPTVPTVRNEKETAPRRRLGIRLIVAYKMAKAALELVGAVAIGAALATGAPFRIDGYVKVLHAHFTSEWSSWLSHVLVSAAEPRHVRMAALALVLDGLMTLFEGTALARAWRWGPWVVVAATSALLPVELAGLVRHGAHLGRLAILAVNVAVVLYLARHALRERGRPHAAS